MWPNICSWRRVLCKFLQSLWCAVLPRWRCNTQSYRLFLVLRLSGGRCIAWVSVCGGSILWLQDWLLPRRCCQMFQSMRSMRNILYNNWQRSRSPRLLWFLPMQPSRSGALWMSCWRSVQPTDGSVQHLRYLWWDVYYFSFSPDLMLIIMIIKHNFPYYR